MVPYKATRTLVGGGVAAGWERGGCSGSVQFGSGGGAYFAMGTMSPQKVHCIGTSEPSNCRFFNGSPTRCSCSIDKCASRLSNGIGTCRIVGDKAEGAGGGESVFVHTETLRYPQR